MYAIVEIAGQQFKVVEGQKIFVHRLEDESGKEVVFENVLLIENDGKITIGEPVINGAFVEGRILDHVRGDKVIVFKKKRKKGYRVRNGHRQNFTQVEITGINRKSAPKKAAPERKEELIVTEVEVIEKLPKEKKSSVKKSDTKKPAAEKKGVASKKASEKKVTEKKPAAKKPATKRTPKAKNNNKPEERLKIYYYGTQERSR